MNADAQDYTGLKVVDIDGSQVGEVVDFFYDAGTNETEWLVVEAGLMSREEVTKQLSPARLSGLETITAAIPVVEPRIPGLDEDSAADAEAGDAENVEPVREAEHADQA